MSTHEALVVPIKLENHPNADSLSLVRIDGFQICVNTEQWQGIDRGIYIKPDTLVKTSLEPFSFLAKEGKDTHRVKVIKLRGLYSQGLLIPSPPDAEINQDYYSQLQLEHYEPELHYNLCSNFLKAPPNFCDLSKYDVENLRNAKVRAMFIDGEMIAPSIKLNGSNMGVVYSDGELWVRSRSGFRAREEGNMFWQCVDNNPNIEKFCVDHPDTILYGEACGQVRGFKYDLKNGEVSFRAFDILRKDRTYMDNSDFVITCNFNGIQMVPQLQTRPFNFEELLELAEQPCPLGNGISEGIVVRPLKWRRDPYLGRVLGKIVSNKYLEKS